MILGDSENEQEESKGLLEQERVNNNNNHDRTASTNQGDQTDQ
jgi:hypothetical protein